MPYLGIASQKRAVFSPIARTILVLCEDVLLRNYDGTFGKKDAFVQ